MPYFSHKVHIICPSCARIRARSQRKRKIDKDCNAVVGIKGHTASYFASLTELELSHADIDGIIQADFNTHIKSPMHSCRWTSSRSPCKSPSSTWRFRSGWKRPYQRHDVPEAPRRVTSPRLGTRRSRDGRERSTRPGPQRCQAEGGLQSRHVAFLFHDRPA